MRRSSSFITAVAVAALALAPSLAFAKAGFGSSMGSRGSRTYSAPPATNTAPSMAAPMDRSMAPRMAPSAPMGAPGAAVSPRRSGFASGLMGGLLGVGLGSMLFGGGMFGGGGFGFLSLISLLIQGALLFFVARWLFRMFANRQQPAMAGGPAMMRQPAPSNVMPMQGAVLGGAALAITKPDYEAFERILQGVQTAWTNADTSTLRTLTTPEMAGYFAEQLAEQNSRGVRNSVTHVKLEQGDLAEAWAENGIDYATVAMRFSSLDVTRDSAGRVVDGDLALRSMTTELWTFMRARGGQWTLSAIQQTR